MKKRFVLSILIISIIMYFIIIIINYKTDVFSIHTKHEYYLNDTSYSRYQNIGISKNNHYDVIIAGTSLSENFKTSLLNNIFDAKSIKIPMSGASAKEQSILVANSIKKQTKKIIWDIHYTSYHGKSDRMHKSHLFPLYLYDNSMLNDIKLYASFDTFKLSLKYILFKDKYFTNNLDELYNWYKKDKNKFSKNNVTKYIESLKIRINNVKYNEDYSFNNLKSNFNINILPIIKENPNVEFNFFFPPYTIYYFQSFYKSNKLNDIINFKEYFILQSQIYENIRIHDFSIDYKSIENLDNYKDTHHFSQDISDKILKDIRNDKFLVNKSNYDKNIIEYKKYIIQQLENN